MIRRSGRGTGNCQIGNQGPGQRRVHFALLGAGPRIRTRHSQEGHEAAERPPEFNVGGGAEAGQGGRPAVSEAFHHASRARGEYRRQPGRQGTASPVLVVLVRGVGRNGPVPAPTGGLGRKEAPQAQGGVRRPRRPDSPERAERAAASRPERRPTRRTAGRANAPAYLPQRSGPRLHILRWTPSGQRMPSEAAVTTGCCGACAGGAAAPCPGSR